MAQNTISGKLKLKLFLGEHISRLPAFGNHGFLSFMTIIIQNPFSPPSTEYFQTPLGIHIATVAVPAVFTMSDQVARYMT